MHAKYNFVVLATMCVHMVVIIILALTRPVKLNKLCFIGLGSHGSKQLAKITNEAQESDHLNPNSHDDLSDG